MKKLRNVLVVFLTLVSIGFSVVACNPNGVGSGTNNGNTDGKDNEEYKVPPLSEIFVGESLPPSVGSNELGNKTTFGVFSRVGKLVLNSDGTYEYYYQKRDNSGYMLDNNGKYIWVTYITGKYSWNTPGNTITFKPEKNRINQDSDLMSMTEYYEFITNWDIYPLNGFNKPTEFLKDSMSSAFGNITCEYFFYDGQLFTQRKLPASNGINEIAGKTYTLPGASPGNDPFGIRLIFTDSAFTFQKGNTSYTDSYGEYSWDSQKKIVYFKTTNVKIDGSILDKKEFYELGMTKRTHDGGDESAIFFWNFTDAYGEKIEDFFLAFTQDWFQINDTADYDNTRMIIYQNAGRYQ